jgi:hypothetical protein
MNVIQDPSNLEVSRRARLIGEKAVSNFMEILEENTFVEDEELFLENEDVEADFVSESECEEESTESSTPPLQSAGECYEPSPKSPKFVRVSLETKIKVVNHSKEHPNWSLATLQKRGSNLLKRKSQLKAWNKDIENGGTRLGKCEMIKKCTYDRFCEARKRTEQVTSRSLQQWALAVAYQHMSPEFEFSASRSWLINFKKEYKTRQRKVMNYVYGNKTA